jgi:hypothetical protein
VHPASRDAARWTGEGGTPASLFPRPYAAAAPQVRVNSDMPLADDLGERQAEWVGIDQAFSVGLDENP